MMDNGTRQPATRTSMVKTTLLKTGLLFVLVFALSAPSAAPAQTCTEYAASRVTERTMSDRRAHGRLLAADAHLTAVGDFDGDGRTDEAFFTLLVDGNYVVVACLEDGKRAVRMPRFEVRGPGFCCYGIHTLPPGIHLSRCDGLVPLISSFTAAALGHARLPLRERHLEPPDGEGSWNAHLVPWTELAGLVVDPAHCERGVVRRQQP